ncbi:3-deoxy-7-phosphoheptulonate synthase [Streptomyces coeruleorubidus]|uniref:3-deoxy-7-phosphoheptulonate synthase n=1 Tax=Streptomyces coeruleorubidus TaxID=116188 RepID=UPI00237F95FF|nr:3-deoxy-7-phosphoheptulonate synthase [Streptomyces coeruleorubidus]WDV51790.1 3-deoxy-7-phosphoheptulonate synthase [Streptomyces coeruleorubidus]
MENTLLDIRLKAALHQPDWEDPSQVERVRKELAARSPLVAGDDIRRFKSLLAQVAAGQAHVIQAGDCAEDPAECTAEHVARKAAVLDLLAGAMRLITRKPVLRVGRIAGQYAKPRSQPTEMVDGVELPVYRGHMVNSPEPDPDSRRPDPLRLLTGYMSARDVMGHLGWQPGGSARFGIDPPVWTSHEALLLDYEVPMLRRDEGGRLLLTSTHWPWVGERTREVDGAHVALLAEVDNPVASKVGPRMAVDELLALCERLDPNREPGRLTLIARMGADAVADALPPLVTAVREAGHPVIWLTDPMHGNTVKTRDGVKTRFVETVEREVVAFHRAVTSAGGIAGGLHLETTPHAVTECVADESATDCAGSHYTTFCDPRLNPGQAVSVVSAWSL